MYNKNTANKNRIVNQEVVININGVKQNGKYEYKNAAVEYYQKKRLALIEKEGDQDDVFLARARYKSGVINTSGFPHTPVAGEFLFASRQNGYFSDALVGSPTFKDLYEIPVIENEMDWLLYPVTNTENRPSFFIYKNRICLYGKIVENSIYMNADSNSFLPLLQVCDKYEYQESTSPVTGFRNNGIITLSSPFYKGLKILFYKDLTAGEEGLAYVNWGGKTDNNDNFRIPGNSGFYEVFIIGNSQNKLDKVKINELVYYPKTDQPVSIPNIEGYVGNKLELYKKGEKLHFAYMLDLRSEFPLTILKIEIWDEVKGDWNDPIDLKISMGDVRGIVQYIDVKQEELYFNIPIVYELTIDYLNIKSLDKLFISYWDIKREVSYTIRNKTGNKIFLTTEPIMIENRVGVGIKELLFTGEITRINIVEHSTKALICGYSKTGLTKIPDDFIIVDLQTPKTITYNESENFSFNITASYKGTIELTDIGIVQVYDQTNEYYETSDFSIRQINNLEYTISMNKIFTHPKGTDKSILRFSFIYKCKRKDGTTLDWYSEEQQITVMTKFFENRWSLEDLEIDNELIGDGKLYFKVKDLLLNKYTDLFSKDNRLILDGTITIDGAILTDKTLYWDTNTKRWNVEINMTGYDTFSVIYKEKYAHSNKVTIEHKEPEHPLKIKFVPKTFYINKTGRQVIELTFDEPIKEIYTNHGLLSMNLQIPVENAIDGNAYLSPIKNPLSPNEIIAIGLDVTKTTLAISEVNFDIVNINGRDFSKWVRKFNETIIISNDKVFGFDFKVKDFEFGVDSTGILNLNMPGFTTAVIDANVYYLENGNIISSPTFRSIEDGKYKTENLFIDKFLNTKSKFGLKLTVTDYTTGRRDDTVPNTLIYIEDIEFEVPNVNN